MEARHSLASLCRQQPVNISLVVLKHVLGQACRAFAPVENGEVLLFVTVSVCHVGADGRAFWQVFLRRVIKTVCKPVSLRLSF